MSEQSDGTADLWTQMEELEDQGATQEQALFFCLLVPKGKLSSHDEKKATHVFIDSFDDAEKQNLDSFWLALLAPSISAVVRRWGRRFRSSWTD